MQLEEFNAFDGPAAAEIVGVWAAIPTWVDRIVAARPYASVASLAAEAADGATHWSGDDLDTALAHHPRIGSRVSGAGAEATASRAEQASMADAEAIVTERIADGNRAYEERFGRVFLIRAAGRTPEEMLAELERRLGNDDATESVEARTQLAEIALLRLRGAFAPDAGSGRVRA